MSSRPAQTESGLRQRGQGDRQRGEPQRDEGKAEPQKAAGHKFSLFEACALNTLNMFGTGPFVSLPFLVSSTRPPGPQALAGYVLAAVTCFLDSFIWAELGALFPHSGGSYVYLRRCFGEYGSFAAFLYVWQQVLSGPMEIASGYAAMSKYFGYVTELSPVQECSLASAFAIATVALLYRDTGSVGSMTVALWIGTALAVAVTLGVGLLGGEAENLQPTPGVWTAGAGFYVSLGAAMRFSLYDLFGYYDVCFIGDEVQNPRRTIPIACVATCGLIGILFLLVDLSILGYLPWDGDGGVVDLVQQGDPRANQIMGLFAEKAFGKEVAAAFCLLVMYTIFGSSFSLMVGYAAIPAAAAKDGTFFKYFDHSHPTVEGLYDRSLLLTGALTVVFCWFDLELIIGGMVTTRLVVQFVAQSLAVMNHRRTHPRAVRPFSVPWYPWTCIIQMVMMLFVFFTSDSILLGTGQGLPLLEGAVGLVLSGCIVHAVWGQRSSTQQQQRMWGGDPVLVTQETYGWDSQRGWVPTSTEPAVVPPPPAPGMAWGAAQPHTPPEADEDGWQYTADGGETWHRELQWDSTLRRRSLVRKPVPADAIQDAQEPVASGLADELRGVHESWLRAAALKMREQIVDAIRRAVSEGDAAPSVFVSKLGDRVAQDRVVSVVEEWLLRQGFAKGECGSGGGSFETVASDSGVAFRFTISEPSAAHLSGG